MFGEEWGLHKSIKHERRLRECFQLCEDPLNQIRCCRGGQVCRTTKELKQPGCSFIFGWSVGEDARECGTESLRMSALRHALRQLLH